MPSRTWVPFSRGLIGISHLRWLGPEKGVIHLATAAVLNAVWDLFAKVRGLPVWRLVAGMTPEELVALVDFRYLTDALTPDQALDILRAAEPGKADRIAQLEATGYPAYTTSAGWLGYDDDKVRRLCQEALADGFTPLQAQGGPKPGGRPAAHPDRPRGHRTGPAADGGRQPGLERARGHRVDACPGRGPPDVDRGAHQPR